MNLSCHFKPAALSCAVGIALSSPIHAASITDQLIIKYKQGNGPVLYESTQNVHNLTTTAGVTLAHAKFMYDGKQVVKLTKNYNALELKSIIAKLSNDPNILYVEEDRLLQASAIPNDTLYSLQWHYFEAVGGINLEAAWDVTSGAGATIAVLDTGYRPHADLAANIVGGYDMIDDATVGNDGDARDSDPSDPGDWLAVNECGFLQPIQAIDSSWHGTHVAGTIGAVTNNNVGVAGIAYNATIVPVRVLGKCGGYLSDIADGMVWASGGAVTGVPNNPNPAQVLNLSLGGSGSCSATSQAAINTAVSNGAVVVVAAGNDDADVTDYNPGNCDNVISVAATDRLADRAYYSNYGGLIDIAAPGGDVTVGSGQDGVYSTLNSGTTVPSTDNYAYYQGTSMAAPHVAGVAGLMFSVNPTLTPAQVETTIKTTARAFPGGSSCNTSNCGEGIIDAAAAVAAVNLGPVATLSALETELSVCTTDNSTAYSLSLTDFDASTDLVLDICPAGGSCGFTTNPVDFPVTTSSLNISNITAIAPATYNMVVTGTDSVDGAITDDLGLTLNVLASAVAPTLIQPADAMVAVSVLPTLSWTASSQATTYSIEIATDVGFSNIVESATGIVGTSYDVVNTLDTSTTYYWRVTAVNACGSGVTTSFSFTTGSEVCTIYESEDVPTTIIDNGSTTSVLHIVDNGSISDVNVVNFSGTHSWMEDLDFSLLSPNGTTVELFTDICGSGDDWDLNLDDQSPLSTFDCPPTTGLSYQPKGTLADFNTEEINGTWTLNIVDDEAFITGTVQSWGVEVCYIPPVTNFPPTAVDDMATTNEDTMVSVAVLTGDTDPDVGDTLSVTSCSAASNGTVVQNGNHCEFTPSTNFNGTGSFSYGISDGNGGTDSATVTVTVEAVNDAPTAVDDMATTNEDTMVSVAVLTGDTDPDVGDTLSVTSCSAASNGTVVQNGNHCEFTPSTNFNGTGSFSYGISDGNGGTDSATVTVTVEAVNDAPTAVNDVATTNEDTMVSVAVLTGDTDPDVGDTLSVTSCSAASNGTVVQNGNHCEFTPSTNFNGTGSFSYGISDGNGGTDSATVTVTVEAVDDAPEAVTDNFSVDEDSIINSLAVLINDTDIDGGDLYITAVGAAAHGVVVQNGNNIDYTPEADYCGSDAFIYSINGDSSTNVTVDVLCVNDQPSMTVNGHMYIGLDELSNPPAKQVACQFDFGPDNEDATQHVLDMIVVSNDPDNILTSIDVDNTGELTYSFSGSTGVAEISLSLQDDGGISHGGDDTSEVHTFNIHVADYIFKHGFETDVCQ